MTFKFADLFAGIGGFHGALAALGGELALAAETDRDASRVYRSNWGADPTADVRELAVRPDLIPPHAVLAAGFPCQPFSKSGRQRGMNEARGTLFNDLLEIIRVGRPSVVMLENVRNLSGPRQRDAWEAVTSGLRSIGYRVPSRPAVLSPHKLHPALGGTPQHRERVYILGTYVGVQRAQRETDLAPVSEIQSEAWDPKQWSLDGVLEPRASYDLQLGAAERRAVEVWNALLAARPPVPLVSFPMWSDLWRAGVAVDQEAPLWKQRIQRRNVEYYESNRATIDRWRKSSDVDSLPLSWRKLEWQADHHLRDLRAHMFQFRPSGIRVKRMNYAPALVAIGQTPIVGEQMRRFSPRELARLQGFPDSFNFGDQRFQATQKQLGNAVNIATAYFALRQHVMRDEQVILDYQEGVGDPLGAVELVKSVLESPARPVFDRASHDDGAPGTP